MTEDWAVALVAESIREVLSAALGGPMPAPRESLDRCDTTDFTAGTDSDEAYTWSAGRGGCDAAGPDKPASDQPLYRCLFQWWERDRLGADAVDHGQALRAAYSESYFAALRMVPVPEGCTSASSSREECEEKYPVVEDFAGIGVLMEVSQDYSLALKQDFLGLGAGATFAVPRFLAPIQIIVRGQYAVGGDTALARGGLGLRWYPCREPCRNTAGPFVGIHGDLGGIFNQGPGPAQLLWHGGGALEGGFRFINLDDTTLSVSAQLGAATQLGASLGAKLTLVAR